MFKSMVYVGDCEFGLAIIIFSCAMYLKTKNKQAGWCRV